MFFLTKRYTSEVLICTNAVTDYISRRSNGGSVGKKLDGECLGQGPPPLSLSVSVSRLQLRAWLPLRHFIREWFNVFSYLRTKFL